MADKEATVFVIDISHYTTAKEDYYSGTALEWCLEYVWDKLGIKIMAARKTDYVAVLAVGSTETDHNMGDEEAYRNIRVILPFPRRNSEEFKSYTFSKSHVDVMMSELHSTKTAEVLSGAILGVQMLTEFCLKLKFKKNLIVLTKGELLTDFTDAEAVATQINSEDISFSVLGVGFDDADYGFKEESKSDTKRTNETNFRKMCEATDGIFASYAEVAESIVTPRIRPVRPVTTFRGILTIGDPAKYANTVEIYVERYPKTKQARVPSASKFSAAAETHSVIVHASQGMRDGYSDDDAPELTHQVLPSRVYKLQDGEELADKSQLEKGYAYGKTVVPISQADEDFLRYPSSVGLCILGFIDSESFARYMGMGESSLIVSRKADKAAALALSSLIHALYESDTYAIARLVRKDDVPPTMVLLAPHIEPDFESLLELPLPFAEDVRQYRFAPLDKIKTSSGDMLERHRYLPSSQLNNAMDTYLKDINIDEIGDADGIATDGFQPEETYNFGVHRVMQAIMFRAFHQPSATIPGPPEILLQNSHIPKAVSEKAQQSLGQVVQFADTKKVPPRTANKRKRGEQEEPVKTGIDLEALLGGSNREIDNGSENKNRKKSVAASIGQAHPAQDFAMMVKDDSLIDAAFQQIQPVLIEMVQYSLGDQTYQSTVEAFSMFRKHAIEQEETELFNLFLERFEEKMTEENRGDFLELIKGKGIVSISAEEAAIPL